ncbi:integrase/recombinase XerD [Virgibacillus natechei]|uniref:Integrase/recombinase XerD n=1 Tax=Virgibacillus natechei TaxID=1216297 RepID=A0ABS4IAQ1_9BACI|nr:tyrosine-type recombinase/integrase [Virgibacillus natechei]MBP1968009.1 integrase/recombinase XerD [Virgibacillus natechei]UZD14708.1 tyrosine-type recombinase/integrase [Virgibacillus natechei]
MLLEDVLEEYYYHCLASGFTDKTMINKNQEYKQLNKFIIEERQVTELESITHHDLKSYIRSKQMSGLQPSSIVSMSKQVRAFFSWCVKEEYIQINPMDKVTLPKVGTKMLTGYTTQEVTTMINCFNNKEYLEIRNKAIVSLMADCGLRSIEIRRFTHSSIHDNFILISGKGNKERIVNLSSIVKKTLIKYERVKKQYFKGKNVPYENYFLNYRGEEMSHVGIHNLVKEAGRRAKVKEARPHKFRHFFAVQSLLNGIDIYSLSKLLGHSEVNTTERYLTSLNVKDLLEDSVKTSPLTNMKK